MKLFNILLTVLVLAISSGNASLAQTENNFIEQIQQLEKRLPGTQGRERFDILLELTNFSFDHNDFKRVRLYGEQALLLLPATVEPESEFLVNRALLYTYIDNLEFELALKTSEQVKKLATELDDKEALAMYYNVMGYLNYFLAEHDKALEFYDKAIQLYEAIGRDKNIGHVFNGKGDVYKTRFELNKAMRQYMLAIRAFEKVGHLKGIGNTYLNIGVIYDELEQYSDEEEAYRHAIAIAVKAGDQFTHALGLWNLGLNVLNRKKEPEEALKFFEQAHVIYQNIQAPTIRFIDIYLAIGEAWQAQNNDQLAMDHYSKALILIKEINDLQGLAHAHELMALVHRKRGNFDTAVELLNQAIKIMREKKYLRNLRKALGFLHEVYAEAGHYREAYKTLEEY
ncbi:MAG: tetratricopeptide repeat protein, partial [Gammaproteobacteria bacterium]|nr:tetratricopeptide repeat protein [Gammaproteobacteria bacterium]